MLKRVLSGGASPTTKCLVDAVAPDFYLIDRLTHCMVAPCKRLLQVCLGVCAAVTGGEGCRRAMLRCRVVFGQVVGRRVCWP